MLDFIIKNYYVILVICILLIFAIIGYIIDTLRNRNILNNTKSEDTYIPEEEIFIQKFEEPEEEVKEESIDDLIKEYNDEQETNSN